MKVKINPECTCEVVEVNGKFITITCEKCEEELNEIHKFPKKTKMRISREQ